MPTFDPEIGLSDDVIAFCPVSAKMTTGVIFGNHEVLGSGMTFRKANPNPDGVVSVPNYP